ncbi:MAG: DUF1294 domain-containing protein [Coriobacteriales bacterium]|nr:DUF1294 domain-containing protein [Coriobacteriales bacterium]
MHLLFLYLIVINVITFMIFVWDKHVAANGNDVKKRVPEAYLLGLCLIGGSVGGMLAMYTVRHKTKKWYFVWGLPFFIILDFAVVVVMQMCGLI